MDSYTIVVMDYESGSLRFYHFDYEPEDPETWLQEHDPKWKDSQCYWMGVDGSGIDETHHYNADKIKSFDDAEEDNAESN